jgi:hypothetical protein
MDKPPTKTKPGAEDPEAQQLEARLRKLAEEHAKLADDYAARFHRRPNPEDLRIARALRARSRPQWINDALKNPHGWELRTWVSLIPVAIKVRDGDAVAVARDLIAIMPASLRARCPDYPGCPDGKEDWDAFESAAAAVASKIQDEVNIGPKCGDLDAIKIGRLALEAMGDKRARHLRLLRPPTD